MSSSYLPIFGNDKYGGGDVETGNALYPGISSTDNMLRLGCAALQSIRLSSLQGGLQPCLASLPNSPPTWLHLLLLQIYS